MNKKYNCNKNLIKSEDGLLKISNKKKFQEDLESKIDDVDDNSNNKWVYVTVYSDENKRNKIEKIYGPFSQEEVVDATSGLDDSGYYEYEILSDSDMSTLDLNEVDLLTFPTDDYIEDEEEIEEVNESKNDNKKKKNRVRFSANPQGDIDFFNNSFGSGMNLAGTSSCVEALSITEAFKSLDDFSDEDTFKYVTIKEKKNKQKFNNKVKMFLEDLEKEYEERSISKNINLDDYLDDDEIDDLKDFISDEDETTEVITDVNAETVDKLKDSYLGEVICQCPICNSLFYKKPDELVKYENNEDSDYNFDEDRYNVGEECKHCGSEEGFLIVGQVSKFDKDKEDEEDEIDVEETEVDEEPEVEVDEEEREIKEESLSFNDESFNKLLKEKFDVDFVTTGVLFNKNKLIIEGKDSKFIFTKMSKNGYKGLNEKLNLNIKLKTKTQNNILESVDLTKNSLKEFKDRTYYVVSDCRNPKNATVLPGEDQREKALELGKKYEKLYDNVEVLKFVNGDREVIYSSKKDTIKIKDPNNKVEIEIPDNSKAGEEGNPIQKGLNGRVGKLRFGKLESLKEDDSELSFEEFLDKSSVIVVDDAKSFDINEWEKKLSDEITDEIEEEVEKKETENKFVKYKLTEDKIEKVIDKLKNSDFDTVDGVTSWKTKQFLKKNNLKTEDLQEVLRNLKPEDYRTNSKAVNIEDYNEAIIFIKDSKVKDLGSFHLYIKLDYDNIEETPVIIISFHQSGTNKVKKPFNEETGTLLDLFEDKKSYIVEEKLDDEYYLYIEALNENGEEIYQDKFDADNIKNVLVGIYEYETGDSTYLDVYPVKLTNTLSEVKKEAHNELVDNHFLKDDIEESCKLKENKNFKDLSEEEINKILEKDNYFDCVYLDYGNGKKQIECADRIRWQQLCKELGVDEEHCGGNEVDGYVIWLYDDINEELEDTYNKNYIYLFPDEPAMGNYKKDCRKFNLEFLGKNIYEDEKNLVIKGKLKDLREYADYLDYDLHSDFLYDEDDFAGDII